MDILEMCVKIGNEIIIQGNFDLCVFYVFYVMVEVEMNKMLNLFGNNKCYIVNFGYGVYLDVDFEKVRMFIKIVKLYEIN